MAERWWGQASAWQLGDSRLPRKAAGAGQEIKTRPFQLVTGRVWKGTAFGGARGRTDVPKIVDWYMDKKINIDDLITHVMPVEKINDSFDLMHKGESIRSVVTF
jgi:S-(hydroxymethyl)glutathione dehydrogenase/alcohol dehydrogenase